MVSLENSFYVLSNFSFYSDEAALNQINAKLSSCSGTLYATLIAAVRKPESYATLMLGLG
jgi:hypothetical protein